MTLLKIGQICDLNSSLVCNRPTVGWMDRHTLLQSCKNASKKVSCLVSTMFTYRKNNGPMHCGLKLYETDALIPWARAWESEWVSEQTNEHSGARERSKQCGAREWVSSASERASRWANGAVNYASISQAFCPSWNGQILFIDVLVRARISTC